MPILPHCALGPVAFSAGMQVNAVVLSFLTQEQVDACLGDALGKRRLFMIGTALAALAPSLGWLMAGIVGPFVSPSPRRLND